jgi:hypothetical protein
MNNLHYIIQTLFTIRMSTQLIDQIENDTLSFQQHYIPNISYYLIFCFLSLKKDLPRIARCCKEWGRLVTHKTFINMYHTNESFEFTTHNEILFASGSSLRRLTNHDEILFASRSPLRQLLSNIKLTIHDSLSTADLLIHFPRLYSLSIDITKQNKPKYDMRRVFQALSSNLRVLTIRMLGFIAPEYVDHSFSMFDIALCHLTSLTSLTLICPQIKIFRNVSYLYCMKQLESFSFISSDISTNLAAVAAIGSLSSLTELSMSRNFRFHGLQSLRELCTQPGGLRKIKRLQATFNLKPDHFLECAHLFDQLSSLEAIHYIFCNDEQTWVPTFLHKWVHSFSTSNKQLTNLDVFDIISLHKMIHLNLDNCCLGHDLLPLLILSLSPRLECLFLQNSEYQLSFESLSTCTKLKHLFLGNITGIVDVDQFDMLLNCQELEQIAIINSGIQIRQQLSSDMQQAIKIPSLLFPKLETVLIL